MERNTLNEAIARIEKQLPNHEDHHMLGHFSVLDLRTVVSGTKDLMETIETLNAHAINLGEQLSAKTSTNSEAGFLSQV